MKRFLLVLLLTFLLVCSSIAQLPQQKAQVQLVGIKVFAPDPKKPSQSQVPGQNPGTTLYLKIQQEDKYFVALDKAGSKLLAFTDDKGTDLSKKDTQAFGQNWLGSFPTISKDGHECLIEVGSKHTPRADAANLLLKANIVITCGSDEKTVRQENVALKAGSTISLGSMSIKIDTVGKPVWGDAQLSVRFSSNEVFAKIKHWEFLAPDGKEIEHQRRSGGSTEFDGKMTYFVTYELQKKVDTVTLSLTYFDKMEALLVPIDLKSGVGMGPN